MKPLLVITTALIATQCLAADAPDLGSDTAKLNYSIGYQVGGDFKIQNMELQPELVIRGIQDAINDAAPLMTPEEMQSTMADLGKRIVAERTREKYMKTLNYQKAAKEFMAANAKQEGVVTTASGLQYRILEPGKGRSPGLTDTVTVNYRGTLIDGKEFDSSYRRGAPATFRVNEVIPGWTEALQLMKEGAKWQLFIPFKLAYGETGQLRDKDLIFDIELLSIASSENSTPGQGAATGK